jgi:cation diffusion facilitator family transporter
LFLIRAREHGYYKLLDVRLSLDHDLTIKQGHDIARENAYGWFYLLYADTIASVIVAFFIFKIAMELLKPSVDILMEKSVEPKLLGGYTTIISSFVEVKRVDKVRAREHGHYKLLDIRLSLDFFLTIKQGHDIAHQIRNEIQKKYPDVKEDLRPLIQ